MDWMDANQLGRRNLTPDQRSILRGRRYNRTKKATGGRADRQLGVDKVTAPKTAESLAKEHHVSEKTIRRDGKRAEALDLLARKRRRLSATISPRAAPRWRGRKKLLPIAAN